ncbi:hypothetical protein [Robiginitalea biformata]|uniref:Uncharacterized protein n=1 Tax=Robiginitalea biformata (strain ATCC BAA-864 / DSM 15991 / KCTC 12146 / HTCC2501) TaxID=313596 RepID=A4CHA0_ROBBH|nr:hypothetical protein [Robiginitalea biformata]EAR16308.1 hypothetical protein RB2501_05400 [Robiginitalea biformata HTCC2501]
MTYEFYSGLIVGIISGVCLLILLRTLFSRAKATDRASESPGRDRDQQVQPFIPMNHRQINYFQGGEDASVSRIKEKLRQFKIRNGFYMEADESNW